MVNVALLLDQIIATPLRSMVEAQQESANATVEFLTSLIDENGKPKGIELAYEQTVFDPERGAVSEKNRVKIPLLTLVPVPYLSIDEAEIDFSAKIVATSKQQKGKFVPLYAVYAPKAETKTDLNGELNIKIKVKRTEIPEGIARMITVLSNSITVGEG
ncbi:MULTISPECIES: DUF2589 domain-containing protein [Archaeoglobus]|uniref:DUF2589 domain-containing protein n=2 Tax=Archaeoglobus fulgidus TaxID=2234 RepID=A0A075WDL4_ARCFL|nr:MULTISPECIES: DUF2589 domain-containing protein [Archaeoglobus]AIG97234.1 hypothetical protein AFULGI_00004200 [Archaeoglobus fulgidus DSM 8774]KUJ94390.1 MAG: hypothetical protein XD40_0484 [Archaeoglobus fulgidus]KUK06547.1 MAG: Uncharacterized protein XD48_1227 [Archaeoglobus fulgidus]MDI3497261.1 hypothetical protein [Archaeoglobus sp.]